MKGLLITLALLLSCSYAIRLHLETALIHAQENSFSELVGSQMTLVSVIKDVEVPYAYWSFGLGNNQKETYTLALYKVENLDNNEVTIFLFRSSALSKRDLMFRRPRPSPKTSNTAMTMEFCSSLSKMPPGEATTSISGGLWRLLESCLSWSKPFTVFNRLFPTSSKLRSDCHLTSNGSLERPWKTSDSSNPSNSSLALCK